MAQSIQHDRYPKFVADQVLTEKSLNQMFGYLEEQQRLTRSTLIGIGILCGMNVSVNAAGTALTISHGVGVTSKGYLVPFPETMYTFYNDTFSAEQEVFYSPFLNADETQKFPLHLLHNDGAAEVQKPLSTDFLEDKVVVIFVELLKVDNKNCDPDSCDDKGCTIEVTHRPLLVAKEHINELIYNEDDVPFLHEPTCIEWPEIKMPKYNVPSTLLLSSPAVLRNFLDILTSDFMLNIENVLGATYDSFGYYIQDEFPSNPFSGLRNNFAFLFNGTINAQQLLHVQYYYDFFSDIIMAYEELRNMCNSCLSICCPNEALFPRHLILGDVVPSPDNFRHHWIQSPAVTGGCSSEGRIKFLLKKIILLIQKVSIPRTNFPATNQQRGVQITPSNYGSIPFSDKAIPYYYDIVGAPNELYNNWNFKKTKTKKGDTNLSFDSALYNTNPYFHDPLSYDLEPYNFLRVEGHVGMDWKAALAQVNQIKKEKRLPIDVVALNGDIFALIQSLLTSAAPLADIISGNKAIVGEIRCYFADIESQYDAHAAELRCTITKVMAYFYNLKKEGVKDPPVVTNNFPQSELVRKEFPNYRTLTNTYGEDFDKFYAPFKNQPYVVPEVFIASAQVPTQLLSPVYVMYYLEKIYEALPDGLVALRIADITRRLEDASQFAAYTLLAIDISNNPELELPSLWEESLDAVIRICKAEVFNVLYRNFVINYVLFIANQTFALYAYKNPGVQHKAGVTTGGTLILVYHDKPEVRDTTRRITGSVREVTGASLPGVSILEKGTSNGVVTDANGNFVITVTNANAILVASFVGYKTEEVSTTGTNDLLIILSLSTVGSTTGSATDARAFEKAQPAGSRLNYSFGATKSNKGTRASFMDLRRNNESVRAAGLDDVFEIIDGAAKDDLSNQELTALVDQFQEGTVIADFFVPNMCKSSCSPMNFMVVNPEDLPNKPTPDPDSGTSPTEIISSDFPAINLRWGMERRGFTSLVIRSSDNDIGSSNFPEEVAVDGLVNLLQVRLLGANDKWLEKKPKLHLFRYKPKKRVKDLSLSGFRKEAPITLSYYKRVNEFDVTDKEMLIDIRPERYFSIKRSKKDIRPMGLNSLHHKMYFYVALSVENEGEVVFSKPSKIFRITINDDNLFSFHIS